MFSIFPVAAGVLFLIDPEPRRLAPGLAEANPALAAREMEALEAGN
jgi:hypothetical protein